MTRRKLQQDPTGCGIACVAMLTHIGYVQARALAQRLNIGPRDYQYRLDGKTRHVRNAYYTSASQLARMLRVLGARPGRERRLRKAEGLDCDGILGINYDRRRETWHWVAYVHDADGGYVLDPNPRVRSDRRTDLSRMRCHSFLPMREGPA